MSGLCVIIPSKTASNLKRCVEAVHRCEPEAQIVVVDDGVDMRSPELFGLCNDDPPWRKVTLIDGVKPFVYSGNCNIGIRFAGDRDVVLLNDDALLSTPQGFDLMQKVAIENPEYGVIAASCGTVGNRNQFPQGHGLLHEDPRMVCFVCVLIPRRTIEAVGLLDERFSDYGCEDDDYCLRVRNAGLKIGIHDGVYVDHGSLTSTFRGPAGAGGNFYPNLERFIEKWGVDNWGRERARSEFPQLFPSQISRLFRV